MGGRILGLTLQVMIGLLGSLDLQMLSGLVQLPWAVSYVGIPAGRASCISCMVRISISRLMRGGVLKTLQFLSTSHSRWCQLKLPNHSM